MIRKSFSTRLTWFISALLLLTIVTIIVKEFVIDNNSIYVGKPVESIAFNPDGKEIATISSNGPQIWSSTDHSLLKSLGDQWGAPIVAWSPDGQLLATQGPAFTIRVWRVSTGQQIYALSGHSGSINSIAWSVDGNMLVSGSDDHTVRLWDTSSRTAKYILQGHTIPSPKLRWHERGFCRTVGYLANTRNGGTTKAYAGHYSTLALPAS